MGLLSKIFGKDKHTGSEGLPSDWKETLRNCNLSMARRAIADVFRQANQQGKAEGKQFVVKKEVAERWDQFAANPCYDTALRFVMVNTPSFRYFDNSTLRYLYSPICTATTFSFDDYRLPNTTSDIKDLKELSQQEYTIFPRRFKGESIYHATPIRFMGRQWDFMIASVHGKIYKWAVSLKSGLNEDSEVIANKIIDYCIRWLGATTEENDGHLLWDTSDGNVVLQLTKMDHASDISIFITSREIRSLS
jgi:hypothetical protein